MHLPQGSPAPYEVRVPLLCTRCQERWGLSPGALLPSQDPQGCPLRPLQPGGAALAGPAGVFPRQRFLNPAQFLEAPGPSQPERKRRPGTPSLSGQKSCLVEAGETASSCADQLC